MSDPTNLPTTRTWLDQADYALRAWAPNPSTFNRHQVELFNRYLDRADITNLHLETRNQLLEGAHESARGASASAQATVARVRADNDRIKEIAANNGFIPEDLPQPLSRLTLSPPSQDTAPSPMGHETARADRSLFFANAGIAAPASEVDEDE